MTGRSIWDHFNSLESFFMDFSRIDGPLIEMSIYAVLGLFLVLSLASVSLIVSLVSHYFPIIIRSIRLGIPSFIVRLFIKPGQTKKILGVTVHYNESKKILTFYKVKKLRVNDDFWKDYKYAGKISFLKLNVL